MPSIQSYRLLLSVLSISMAATLPACDSGENPAVAQFVGSDGNDDGNDASDDWSDSLGATETEDKTCDEELHSTGAQAAPNFITIAGAYDSSPGEILDIESQAYTYTTKTYPPKEYCQYRVVISSNRGSKITVTFGKKPSGGKQTWDVTDAMFGGALGGHSARVTYGGNGQSGSYEGDTITTETTPSGFSMTTTELPLWIDGYGQPKYHVSFRADVY